MIDSSVFDRVSFEATHPLIAQVVRVRSVGCLDGPFKFLTGVIKNITLQTRSGKRRGDLQDNLCKLKSMTVVRHNSGRVASLNGNGEVNQAGAARSLPPFIDLAER